MGQRRVPVIIATLFGLALFIGVRWTTVSTVNAVEWPELLWFAFPLGVTYLAATAMGVVLVADGTPRWWWLPGALFVAIGAPVEGYVTIPRTTWNVASIISMAIDAVLVLSPAVVAWLRTSPERTRVPGRAVPVLGLTCTSLVLAILVGQTGPDVPMSVGAALVSFGACSRSSSSGRALLFVAIAIALGAQIPASFVNGISQGSLGPVAIRDASMVVVVACLSFAIAPLSTAWARILERHAESRSTSRRRAAAHV
jgi:hypothetical protein